MCVCVCVCVCVSEQVHSISLYLFHLLSIDYTARIYFIPIFLRQRFASSLWAC